MAILTTPCLEPAPTSRVIRHHTYSVQQHVAGYQGWDLHVMQLSEGRFDGEITFVDLEGVRVVRDQSSQAMLKQGGLKSTSVSFSFPLVRPETPLICQGKSYPGAGILAIRGGELPEIRVAAGLDLLSMSVDYPYLATLLHGPDAPIEGLLTGPNYLPTTTDYQALSQLFELTCRTLSQAPPPALIRELRDAFVGHMLDALEYGEVEPVTPSARKRVVDRAREVIAAHDSEPIAIPSLCHQIGVSRRKLQYCFQECIGVSPYTYVRLFRLNAIHRALTYGDDDMRVQDEAARWGFFHLGRFSMEYRRLFGERPSDTLNRARRNRAISG
ncbi:helix-turn-helix domain-containing protein [Larsenimonas salina]|uniref:helix-turn-helix domain-containing protein n=1 Tax=Larsenimonas salina TaxID=1295565 RepID=UPI00207350A2|nr:helix-turn-helix domain-containing protein [Larsenimonas salina]MCM5705068.1 helix-turn-helix domain-containing protein [Larsenimonas salina]